MGSRAGAQLASVSPGDIISFRNKLREEGRAANTCNSIIKGALSGPFEVARKLGFVPINPVSSVEPLEDRSEKQGVSRLRHDELPNSWQRHRRLARGAVLLGATSGLRLSDLANLCWESVDIAAGLLRIETSKTGKVVILPMHSNFASWLSQGRAGLARLPFSLSWVESSSLGVEAYLFNSMISPRRLASQAVS